MNGVILSITALMLGPSCQAWAENSQHYPATQISNGILTAKFYIPDSERGSYHGTRFDWSGIITSLTYQGHQFFGQWYAKHDPLIHDAITGPVDVFGSTAGGLGYADAKVGGTFVRIGVGRIEKEDEPRFQETHTYKIVDPGRRTLRQGTDWIEFTHEVSDPLGYAYVYTKRISLLTGKPQMVLSHVLKNVGSKPIETSVFNHGFFQIDGQPAGPDLVWTFPFKSVTSGDFAGMAVIRGNEIVYLRELKTGERVLVPLEGFGSSSADYQFVLENRKSGAGVRVSGDRPITKLNFWSRTLAYSPEAYVHLLVLPGKEEKWATTYDFYTLQPGKKASERTIDRRD